MEYSPFAKINKSPKEKQALIDAPVPIGARSLYAKSYAKHGKTIGQSKDAKNKAYESVEKQHGKEMREKLKSLHEKNSSDEGDFDAFAHLKKAHGGAINLKNCKVNTCESNPKCKSF
jgi:glutamine synthetase adenylyltransferase